MRLSGRKNRFVRLVEGLLWRAEKEDGRAAVFAEGAIAEGKVGAGEKEGGGGCEEE